MKILTLKNLFFCLVALCIYPSNSYAQDGNVTVTQDPKFEQLLNEKRKINASITVNDCYKIQIYNGESESAKKALGDFKKNFKNFDGTIIFSTPTYKVWVGNFKNRIDAERNLIDIKKRFTNAFLIKPNK